jgi:pimeloyl-ACP methyl ester carboxylesterase
MVGDAFDVVVPSLPGYGFSEPRERNGGLFGFGDLWQKLMTEELGYSRFGAHGGDWGSTITEHLARSHAASVVGIHLTDVPFWHIFQKPSDLTQNEQKFLERNKRWQKEDGAYAMLSLQTLASLATYRCSVIWSPDSVPKLASN